MSTANCVSKSRMLESSSVEDRGSDLLSELCDHLRTLKPVFCNLKATYDEGLIQAASIHLALSASLLQVAKDLQPELSVNNKSVRHIVDGICRQHGVNRSRVTKHPAKKLLGVA